MSIDARTPEFRASYLMNCDYFCLEGDASDSKVKKSGGATVAYCVHPLPPLVLPSWRKTIGRSATRKCAFDNLQKLVTNKEPSSRFEWWTDLTAFLRRTEFDRS